VAQKLRALTIDPAQVRRLAEVHRGQLVSPGDPGYDEVRKLYNAMVDRRPGLIARCTGTADVIAVVGFSRENGWDIAVRGGGHNLPGTSVCDGGVVIDCSALRSIGVDPKTRTARAEPGIRGGWSSTPRRRPSSSPPPEGPSSDTGIAGLTLGGGLGWLGGHYGLASDNLLAPTWSPPTATCSTPVRTSIRTSSGRWAAGRQLRRDHVVRVPAPPYRPRAGRPGGAPLRARPLRAPLLLGVHLGDARRTLHRLLLPHPPDAGPAVGVAAVWSGPIKEGEKVLQPLRTFGPPVEGTIAVVSYRTVHTMLDPLCPPGLR
jgi:FAD/FMN-containing dehydrogenase